MYAKVNPAANKAREAVCKRWGKDAIGTFGIGYAPVEGFIAWAKQKGLDLDILEQVGLIGNGERGQFAMLRDRYTIPIYDKMSRVIGFTARTMSDNKDICKYLNLKNSLVYHKDTSVLVSISPRRRHVCVISSISSRVLQTCSSFSLSAFSIQWLHWAVHGPRTS